MEKRKFENNQNTQTPKTDLADQILEHELLKEAARIEEEAKDTEVPFQEGDEERLFARIMEQVEKQKEQGKTTSKIEEFTRSADEYERKRKRRFRMATRAAAAVVVLSVGIFGFAMTSEGNRLRVMEILDQTFSTDSKIKVNNNTDRQYSADDETIARDEIYNQLQVSVPEFFYVPEGMVFNSYSIVSESGSAYITYDYEGENLILYISTDEQDNSVNNSTNDVGTLVDTIEMNIKGENVEIELWNIENDDVNIIQWKYHNTYYEFGGKISEEEIRNMVQHIFF